MPAMDRKRFESYVARALDSLPQEFLEQLDNVDILIADRPTKAQQHGDKGLLLGLYEGVPQTERGAAYGLVIPDRITLFQEAIEAVCSTEDEIIKEIGATLRHEVAHHFGISDERLDELEEQGS